MDYKILKIDNVNRKKHEVPLSKLFYLYKNKERASTLILVGSLNGGKKKKRVVIQEITCFALDSTRLAGSSLGLLPRLSWTSFSFLHSSSSDLQKLQEEQTVEAVSLVGFFLLDSFFQGEEMCENI